MQCSQALLGVIHTIHDGIAGDDLGIRVRRVFGELLDHCRLGALHRATGRNSRLGTGWCRPHADYLPLKVLPQEIQGFVCLAVKRILLNQRLQSRNRSRIRLPQIIEAPDLKFPLAQHLLHFEQPLFALRHQFLVVRILQDQVAILLLCPLGVRVVPVRLLHLLVLDVGNLQLRLGCLRHVGKEGLEIAILLLRLRQRRGSTLRIPRVAHRQLGPRDELRVGIRVDQCLQRHPRHVKAVVLHGIHRPVEQHLVRLLGSNIRQGINRFLVRAGHREHQQHARKRNRGNST